MCELRRGQGAQESEVMSCFERFFRVGRYRVVVLAGMDGNPIILWKPEPTNGLSPDEMDGFHTKLYAVMDAINDHRTEAREEARKAPQQG